MSNLYIIATRHDDFVRGPEKLRQVYDQIKPDVLLSEMHETTVLRSNQLSKKFINGLSRFSDDSEGLEKLLDFVLNIHLGFEYPFNQAYSKDKGIPHILIDTPGCFEKLFNMAEYWVDKAIENAESVGKINPRKLVLYLKNEVLNPSPNDLSDLWKKLKNSENGIKSEFNLFFNRFFLGRTGPSDKYMEERVREVYDPSKTITCTVGMLHAIDSLFQSTLYSRIRDLKPERIPLIE